MKNGKKRFVIMRTDRIGEVLLSTVAVDCIKDIYPRARITFVTSEYSRPVVEGCPGIEEIITVDIMEKKGWLKESLSLARALKEREFEAAIVLNPHKALHLACFLAGIPKRAGYDRKWGFLLNRAIKDDRAKGDKHEIQYTLDLLRVIGIDAVPRGPRLAIEKQAAEKVDELLSRIGIDLTRPLVAVHPGSSNPAKMWPEEMYAELIKRLKNGPDPVVAVIGSGEERALASRIIEASGGAALDLAGKFDIKELVAFLGKASLFIGNDAGPMHLAAAVNVPVIAIFGRKVPGVSPRRWGPWGRKNIVLHVDPGCEPCFDQNCPYARKCLREVKVDDVFGTAVKVLEKR